MRVSKNFVLQEFIDPDTYSIFGDSSIWFIDQKVIHIAQFCRDHFDKSVIVNNWCFKGKRKYSGFRPPQCKVGATLSQHRFGRGLDMVIKDVTPAEARNEIRKKYHLFRANGLTTIEKNTPTWLHCDCRHTGTDELFEVPYN